jgi:O-antigen ligase
VPAWAAVAGGLALLAVLALALLRFEAVVALGFVLFAVVQVEPAPSDLVFAVAIAVAVASGRFRIGATPYGLVVAIAAFVGLNVASTMEAVELGRAAKFASITVFLLAFALWVAGWAGRRDRVRMLVRIYVAIAVVSAALGSAALFVPIPGHDLLTAYTGTRARALFKDPNVFGPFLVPAALLLVHELLRPRLLRGRRLTKLAALAVVVVGILLSYSRAAWLDFAVGVLVMGAVFALRRGGLDRALVFAGIVAFAIVTVAIAVDVSGQASFLRERARLQSYDTQRFAAQSGGLRLGLEHPLGVGPGQFELHEPISAHSTYVRALAEEGPVGFLLVASIMVGTLLLAFRNADRGRDTAGISSTVLLAAWCGILANSFFIDTLHWRHLWLVAGLVWGARSSPVGAATRVGRSRPSRAVGGRGPRGGRAPRASARA